MTPKVLFYPLLLVALGWICGRMHVWWPDPYSATPPRPLQPHKPRRKRSTEPKPVTLPPHTAVQGLRAP
jgi:hypothetical protein